MLLLLLFLYVPIFVLIVYSFNTTKSRTVFEGFTFDWYIKLFQNELILTSLRNTIIISVVASVCATALGTAAAIGINSMRKFPKAVVMNVTNIPIINPEIVTGVSLMLLFVGVGTIVGISDVLGVWTMLLAHTTFNLPYVFLSVLPKFRQMDKHLTEAALDLGCTPAQTFLRVELPSILPGVLSGFMMSFTLSLDDFVISHFVSNSDFVTLPLYIYNQTAHEVKFSMYALCTLMIVAITLLLLAVNFAGSVGEHKKRRVKGGRTK